MKMRKLETFWDKIRSTGCKQSSLNAQGKETPVSHSVKTDISPAEPPAKSPAEDLWPRNPDIRPLPNFR